MKKTLEQHQQDRAMRLSEEFTDNLIEQNIQLIESIEAEQFELAAKYRDNIKILVETITFNVKNLLEIDENILREHYYQQNEIAFNQLKTAYDKY